MTIFKHKTNKQLYYIYRVTPRMYTGGWYEAVPYKWEGKTIKASTLNKFEAIEKINDDPWLYHNVMFRRCECGCGK